MRVRKLVLITKRQDEFLKIVSRKSDISVSEVMRRIIDDFIDRSSDKSLLVDIPDDIPPTKLFGFE